MWLRRLRAPLLLLPVLLVAAIVAAAARAMRRPRGMPRRRHSTSSSSTTTPTPTCAGRPCGQRRTTRHGALFSPLLPKLVALIATSSTAGRCCRGVGTRRPCAPRRDATAATGASTRRLRAPGGPREPLAQLLVRHGPRHDATRVLVPARDGLRAVVVVAVVVSVALSARATVSARRHGARRRAHANCITRDAGRAIAGVRTAAAAAHLAHAAAGRCSYTAATTVPPTDAAQRG